MSLYIPGCGLPKEGNKLLVIFPDGVVNEVEPGTPYYEAKQLQPHGRLIDADTLVEAIKTTQPYYPLILFGTSEGQKAIYIQKIVETINAQPTIIEAEGKETLKDRLAECDAGDLFPELTEEEKAENKRLAKDFKGAEGSGT